MQDKAEFYSEVLTVVVDGKKKSQSSGCSAPRVQAETDSHRLRSRVIADSKLYGKRPGSQAPGRLLSALPKLRRLVYDVAKHPMLIHSGQPEHHHSDVQPLTADLRRDFTDSCHSPQMVR